MCRVSRLAADSTSIVTARKALAICRTLCTVGFLAPAHMGLVTFPGTSLFPGDRLTSGTVLQTGPVREDG